MPSSELPSGYSKVSFQYNENKLDGYQYIEKNVTYAADETVTLVGPSLKSIEKVRVLGPVRKDTQVEISRTDTFVLKVSPPVRPSGQVKPSRQVKPSGAAVRPSRGNGSYKNPDRDNAVSVNRPGTRPGRPSGNASAGRPC